MKRTPGERGNSRRAASTSDGRGSLAWRRLTAALAAGLLLAAPPGHAEAQDSSEEGLEYRASLELPLTLVGVTGSLLLSRFADDDADWVCRWCERDATGRITVNSLDAAARDRFRWTDTERADTWSDVALIVSWAGPAALLAADRGGFDEGYADEMGIVAEALALHMVLTQASKVLVRRERPWARFDEPPPGERIGSPESVSSFVSGHASWAFAAAVSAGSVASLRGDRHREWVWATGLTAATTTAYLRVAADWHYLTDVLAGAVVGGAVGWAVPRMIDR